MNTLKNAEKVARLVQEAGGRIIGRTRLQKIACLLELAHEGNGFSFSYHRFGPYSDELSSAIETAETFDMVHEESKRATWGGTYSIYTTDEIIQAESQIRRDIIEVSNKAGAIVLELAATAAYLAATKVEDPWGEVAVRKPEKATPGKLAEAQDLYSQLRAVAPTLPAIP